MARLVIVVLGLVTLALPVALLVSSPYFIISPGGAYEVAPRLRIPDEHAEPVGRLAFTAVLATPGTWAQVAWAGFDPTRRVVPREQIRPHGTTQQQINELNSRLIEESKIIATIVGLRAAGFDASVRGEGALIVGVVPDMPAAGVVGEGDIVVAVDGAPITTSVELVESIRRRTVGDPVDLTLVRDGQHHVVTIQTVNSPDEPGRPLVGAAVATYQFDAALPFPVTIDTENVGGPSAGLMFALGVLDGVTEGLLTRGHYVAGTGTISLDGSVGPIGGAAEKAVAAERDGASVFLVPIENAAEARRTAQAVRVVPVATFDDAVSVLCDLAVRPPAEATQPPPCTRDD